ncbi:MAG: tyrosine--tRNA ligase [Oligoflexia bacterium]|jgi:tyrosyl-tRNA synthetase
MSQSLFLDLESRGIIKQVAERSSLTPHEPGHGGLAGRLSRGPITLYCGFDPTSDSLHVGSLLPLLTLRRFQKAGHRVIAVVGGATGMIGDPSGKSQERSLLTQETLDRNVAGITHAISKFLNLSGPNPALVLNNYDWFKGISYIQFLREIGKHFTVNHMLAKESVRARLEDREHGISYTEFSYMLLQAYDFWHLHKSHGCELQIGGSDQWGNITVGIDLIHKIEGHEAAAFGLTHPLVTKSDGTKFGKTEGGSVWIDPKKTSPYDFYQFFMQTADADVLTYLSYFTELTHSELQSLATALKSAPEAREAQKRLARELTALVHGQTELEKVEGATQALFGADLKTLDAGALKAAFSSAPLFKKEHSALGTWNLVDALYESGLCGSKSMARKDIQSGGIYLNNERVSDVALVLKPEHVLAGGWVILRKGKKTYQVIEVQRT